MNEIKCPHCGQAFTVDEAGYAAILSQVRTKEFDAELHRQLEVMTSAERKESELRLNQAVSEKENEIARLGEQINSMKESAELTVRAEVAKVGNQKETEISELKMKIQQLEADAAQSEGKTELAVSRAVSAEREKYEKKLTESSEELARKREELARKREELVLLGSKLDNAKLESELAIKDAVSKVEKERDTQRAEYEAKLKAQQESIDYYKDLKTRMSTKMIGETLEQHCENSFNMIRATAFRNAEFGKDNTVTDGSKGDYIYRERDEDGCEMISIMFEMKNEMDTTATKHKNEDFFEKLDRDRRNKNCEYAVLVSMLESDSEMYNQGIVDVSWKYEKMYVIRPQFFIPIISLLRNAAMNSMELRREILDLKNRQIDITNFEERITEFKTGFSKNFELAGKQFNTAIEEIDKTIDHLNKVKDNLQKSLNNLRLANNKAQTQLTIKKLAKDNDTMIEMFNVLGSEDENEQ
ncbi:DUF2130 domain-containing protein [Ruminococcus flavefaciens]|uniref:DUF2130 domain-containing protein n=1 Tax=Ruminococcus flavefaciens TaxID=1265 RepID=UPI0026F0EB19|nr:DUF2130 domain-containing protein [Ruminococcus flavefaciens]